ncbi:MAG: hypothetical protein H7070_07580 [Saprospiraceae bacterium]|nr:hypothetical protein [Pyrinomonadaceae bacterium]
MITESSIREILALYEKHGWILRRVLFSDDMNTSLADIRESLFGRVAIFPSTLDALWFSRASSPENEAWEIRHLSETPFALVEVVDRDLTDGERNDALRAAEIKMSEIVKSKRSV